MQAGEFSSGVVVPGTRYRVVGLVGRGGMGLVYDVEHLELGKRFVLKALLSNLARREDIVARLRNEQRALGRLQHPNIVAVTDAGVTSTNIPYFVMERLEGETLGARLRRQRRLPVVEAIAIARGVLDGLSAAHEIGVVHRDIKPQNVFVLPGSRPKILDFGVAKIGDARSVTERGVAIGTPRYMSPEQIRGERIDGRSDLYAVGLVLFESIAGRGPFDELRQAEEMLVAHLERAPPSLAAIATGVTRELDALVASLLAKTPSARPPTARAAAAALAAVVDRYGGGSNLDAPTPHTSYTTTTRTLLQPGSGVSSLVTRPDGVAAREPATVANAATSNGTTEIMPHAPFAADPTNPEGPRAPGGTLYDPSSRVITVAHQFAAMPPDAVRTERLEPLGLPLLADEPTHTRVPATPSEGTLSIVPERVAGPRSHRNRPLVFTLAAAVLLVLIGGGYFFVRGGTKETTGVSTVEPTRAAAERKSPELPREPAMPMPAVTPSATRLPAASAAAEFTPPPGARSASAGAVKRDRALREESVADGAAPRSSASGDRPSKGVPSAIPAGLPGSGL